MISKVGQIMLYVNDQDASLKFWTEKLGFILVSEENHGPMKWFEIAPKDDAQTSIILHNKELIAQMQPQLNLDTPSLLFFSEDLESLYAEFKEKDITVGDLVTMPTGRVFNFADDEGNYFAILEKK
ncbi:VOC family protein [Paenibacillus sp. LMG 31461]|uniref:VOC family protein n=1 Tax=Paenibacillus plantarum TaxID=2654975 RepID=A0ABX1XIN3_9BACL|nr:VOC family protein [Paenibacillus plantarum]NOU67763.1 VOC family protein [Paenibacillus plantarum]